MRKSSLNFFCQLMNRVQTATNFLPGCVLPSPTARVHMRLNTAPFYEEIEPFEGIASMPVTMFDTMETTCFAAINCRSTVT